VSLLFLTQAAAPPENVLLELSHRLDFMLLPISDEVPLFLQRVPHPKTPELRQLGIGEHVGHDQEQRAAPWTTPLFSAGEVPLTVRTLVALRPVFQGDPPKTRSIRPSSRRDNPDLSRYVVSAAPPA